MSKTIKVAAAAGLALLAVTCEKVPMTAPAGTSMFLQCNPCFVPANGGTSVVTALLTEPAGTLVPDGTIVLFLTTLGRIDAQGASHNGLVKVNFVSDARSGTATINAYSGGPPAPAPSASPTPSNDASFSASAHVGQSAGGDIAREETGSGVGTAKITITIGGALPARLVVVANPQRITSPRQSSIVATVYDAVGNPVQNVPVIFSLVPDTTVGGAPVEETLDSGGAPRFTDSNGQAFDTLRTRAPVGGIQKIVTVAAIAPNIDSAATVQVAID
jgi:hypothetical protein